MSSTIATSSVYAFFNNPTITLITYFMLLTTPMSYALPLIIKYLLTVTNLNHLSHSQEILFSRLLFVVVNCYLTAAQAARLEVEQARKNIENQITLWDEQIAIMEHLQSSIDEEDLRRQLNDPYAGSDVAASSIGYQPDDESESKVGQDVATPKILKKQRWDTGSVGSVGSDLRSPRVGSRGRAGAASRNTRYGYERGGSSGTGYAYN